MSTYNKAKKGFDLVASNAKRNAVAPGSRNGPYLSEVCALFSADPGMIPANIKTISEIVGLSKKFALAHRFIEEAERKAGLAPDTYYMATDSSGLRHHLYSDSDGQVHCLTKKHWYKKNFARFGKGEPTVGTRSPQERWTGQSTPSRMQTSQACRN